MHTFVLFLISGLVVSAFAKLAHITITANGNTSAALYMDKVMVS